MLGLCTMFSYYFLLVSALISCKPYAFANFCRIMLTKMKATKKSHQAGGDFFNLFWRWFGIACANTIACHSDYGWYSMKRKDIFPIDVKERLWRRAQIVKKKRKREREKQKEIKKERERASEREDETFRICVNNTYLRAPCAQQGSHLRCVLCNQNTLNKRDIYAFALGLNWSRIKSQCF